MANTDLNIKLGADFTGEKAFKDAVKATDQLSNAAHKLGRQFASVFSVYKIAQFSKNSVKAFMADEQAAKQLANQLRNIGYGDATAGAEDFIASMQKQTGILDDVLRPAYAQLARVTGDLGQTQKILKTAWNVSAGTGTDFAQVVDALSQAYVGNTKGLKSLNTGLTTAELSGKSFSEIMQTLNTQFAGAGQASLNSYAGQVALLSATVQSSMETIGKSIIDAFSIINGQDGIGGTVSALESATNKVSDFIRSLGAAAGILKTAFDPKNWFNPERVKKQVDAITKEFRLKQSIAEQQRNFKEWAPNTPFTAEQKKAAALAAARAKELAALTKKQALAQAELNKKKKEAAALDALSLKYKQAESIFDMDKIELAAAAMSRQSAEDYARIKLKRDLITLQEAIQSGDLAAAQAAAAIVDEDYKRVQAYQALNIAAGIQAGKIYNIGEAAKLIPTDLKLIDLDNLDAALAAIKKLIDELNKVKVNPITSGAAGGSTGGGLPAIVNPDGTLTPRGSHNLPPVEDTPMETFLGNLNDAVATLNANTTALKPMVDSGFFDMAFNAAELTGANINPYQLTDAQAAAYSQGQTTITIVDNTSGLIDVITNTTQQASANGVNTRLVRNTGNLNW